MPFSSTRRIAVATLCASLGCRGGSRGDALELLLPDGSGRTSGVVPRSTYAEYVEIPDALNELRLTFATHDVSCEKYVAPGPEDVLIVITLRLPPGEKPRPGGYGSTPALKDDGGASSPSRAFAQPVVRRGSRAHVLPPGGTLELSSVDFAPTGAVRGSLAFEFAGDGTRPASALRGKFAARICRNDPDPGNR